MDNWSALTSDKDLEEGCVAYLALSVQSGLVLSGSDDNQLLLLFVEEPGLGWGVREGEEDDEAEDKGDGAINDEEILDVLG